MSRCDCGAEIWFVPMVGTGKAMPLNAQPSDVGTIRVRADGQGEVMTEKERKVLRDSGVPVYATHFASCPLAPAYRRR